LAGFIRSVASIEIGSPVESAISQQQSQSMGKLLARPDEIVPTRPALTRKPSQSVQTSVHELVFGDTANRDTEFVDIFNSRVF
jgi:hypothetical protein